MQSLVYIVVGLDSIAGTLDSTWPTTELWIEIRWEQQQMAARLEEVSLTTDR